MVFLMQYRRREGRLVTFGQYDEITSRLSVIEDELEIRLNAANIDDEVVLLEAADQEALRKTHRRYFENPAEIFNSSELSRG